MDQQFTLHYHGHLSLFEQANMTAEERRWWIRRINKEKEAESKQGKSQSPSGMPSKPNIPRPSMPSIPSIPRR